MADRPTDPIDSIEWISVRRLDMNDWNPNYVATPEMRLLRRNLLILGWVQPILVNRDLIIVDGFHRVHLAKEDPHLCRDGDLVPCAILDLPRAEAMMLTVRMNRAKGTHAALRMSSLVQRLIDEENSSVEEVAVGIGATEAEVELLYRGGVFKNRDLASWAYSKAWVPTESRENDETAIQFERDESVAPVRTD